MKTCPSCRKVYEDETLVFCLDDGARLERERSALDPNATWNLPTPGATVASPRPALPTAQSTITSRPGQFQVGSPQVGADGDRSASGRGPWPWVLAIVLVLGVSGVLTAWLLTRGRADEVGKYGSPTPAPSASVGPTPVPTPRADEKPTPKATPDATPDATPKPTAMPTKERPKPMFTVLDNMTLNGSRITYYPRPSFGLCQADCSRNANCKGFTWIRPGAYNPGDSAMCYLMSAVTARIPHSCCISAVRN